MTSGDGTAPLTRTCANPTCGREFRPGIALRERQPQLYCHTPCRLAAERDRVRAKRAARAAVARPLRPCAVCGTPFPAKSKRALLCSEACSEARAVSRQRARNADQRAAIEAIKAAPPKPAPTVCPDCGKPARRATDARNLVYCTYRCGWSVLLTARERDPRAGATDPKPDPDDQEEEDVSEEEDLDTEEREETEEEAPAPAPPTRQRATEATNAAVLDAVRRGLHDPIRMLEALPLGRTALFRSLDALRASGAVLRHRSGRHAAYYLPGEPVPALPQPAPRPKPQRTGTRLRARQETEAATLEAVRAGATTAEAILERVGKHPSSVYLAINRLVEEGKIVRGGKGNRRHYTLGSEPAPTAHEPAPVRNASVTPAPASLRAQIAALPPAELLALLADLEPVAVHARALCAALAGLRGQS